MTGSTSAGGSNDQRNSVPTKRASPHSSLSVPPPASLERRGSLTPGVFSEEPPTFGATSSDPTTNTSSGSGSVDPSTSQSQNDTLAGASSSDPAASSQQSSVDYFKGAAPGKTTLNGEADSPRAQPTDQASSSQLQRESEKAEKGIISASLSISQPISTQAANNSASQPSLLGNSDQVVASPASFAPQNLISMRPDGIGGMGLGTAATAIWAHSPNSRRSTTCAKSSRTSRMTSTQSTQRCP